jgi:hypothetical protein
MGATQMGVYNKALRHLEERKLAALTEQREPLRYLNDEWSDAVEFCLFQGFWNFSIRNQQNNASTQNVPNFGYIFAFPKPTDWVKTFMIADNSDYNPTLRRYDDQNNFWYADVTPLYTKFISNDPNFGLNMALWTPGFIEYLAAYLAWLCAPRLKQAQDKVDRLEKLQKKKRTEAIAIDAMDLPPGQFPVGTWVQSRAPRGSILPIGGPFGLEDD